MFKKIVSYLLKWAPSNELQKALTFPSLTNPIWRRGFDLLFEDSQPSVRRHLSGIRPQPVTHQSVPVLTFYSALQISPDRTLDIYVCRQPAEQIHDAGEPNE